MSDLHNEFFKKIGEVDLERMLLEIESIDCSKQLLLQGTHQNQDPTELVSKVSSGSINAWERKQDNVFTTAEVIHPLFNLPYINSIMNEYVLRYTRLMVLKPKTCYTYHIDKSKRVHIPLITNKENVFVVSVTVSMDVVYKILTLMHLHLEVQHDEIDYHFQITYIRKL
jgi:hypothetical protein